MFFDEKLAYVDVFYEKLYPTLMFCLPRVNNFTEMNTISTARCTGSLRIFAKREATINYNSNNNNNNNIKNNNNNNPLYVGLKSS